MLYKSCERLSLEEHDKIVPNEGPCFDREGGKDFAFAIKDCFYSDGFG